MQFFNISTYNVINAVPFIIFMFIYQPNVPQTYMELHVRTKRTINQVIVRTNTIALVIFLIVGFFGYLIFVDSLQE